MGSFKSSIKGSIYVTPIPVRDLNDSNNAPVNGFQPHPDPS